MKTNKERLQALQKELGLTQKALGTYIGVSARTINSWMGKAESRECPEYVIELAERCAQADLKAMEEDEPATPMMRWTFITGTAMDEYITVCGSKADALREAESYWKSLTDSEKKNRSVHAVALMNVEIARGNRGETVFQNATIDGNAADADWYDTAKDWIGKEFLTLMEKEKIKDEAAQEIFEGTEYDWTAALDNTADADRKAYALDNSEQMREFWLDFFKDELETLRWSDEH